MWNKYNILLGILYTDLYNYIITFISIFKQLYITRHVHQFKW